MDRKREFKERRKRNAIKHKREMIERIQSYAVDVTTFYNTPRHRLMLGINKQIPIRKDADKFNSVKGVE